MKTPLEIATEYQRRGWQPLPIAHRSKNPHFPGWQTFKTTDADLPKYFNGKQQNISVLLGSKSNGITDLDLDSNEAVKTADYFHAPTEAEFGRAGKPRSHRLYYGDEEIYEKYNNPFLLASEDEASRKTACILELRGKAGLQTVFPGSTHEESGEPIEWNKEGEPARITAKELRRRAARQASACLISTFWRSGVRQDLAMTVSGALLRNGFDLAETKNFVKGVCVAANDEETDIRLKAVEATADKIRRGDNVYGFPMLAELTDKKLVETICKWLQIEHKHQAEYQTETINKDESITPVFTNEPKPLDLTLKPVATIDDDSLPKVLIDWLRPAAKVIGCPFDFLVLSAIVMVATVIGSRLRLKPLKHSDWFVVPNIYAGLVGLPSTKKTPALDETRKPILELQHQAREKYKELLKEYELELKFYEKESHKILKESASKEDYKRNIEACPTPDKPTLRRFETNDITSSKLIQFLSENPIGLMLFRDELTGLLNALEAEYDKSARAFFLELWKGAISYELARVDGREIQLTSGTLSIIGGLQPSKLQKLIAEAYSMDKSDGLPQRFPFAYPDFKKQTEKPTQRDYEQMQRGYNAANELIKTLAEFDFNGKVTGANGDKFHVVKFTDEAQMTVDQWLEEIETEAEKLQIEDEVFSAYLYKLPKNCFAIALIFHCLENISQTANNFPEEISNITALKAIAYTEVLITHARRVFALGENQIFALGQTLIGKLKKGELKQGFTAREVARKQWSGLKTPDSIKDVLSLLIDYGYLKSAEIHGDGRPTVRYYIHPSLISEVKDNDEN